MSKILKKESQVEACLDVYQSPQFKKKDDQTLGGSLGKFGMRKYEKSRL